MVGDLKKICKDNINQIENYDKAINDYSQTWECHHRLETDLNLSRQELIDIGRYYNVPACELIFLTRAEHNKLHKTGTHHSETSKKKMSESANRQPRSEEIINKMKEKQKNRIKQPFQGHKHSEETKKRMSEAHNGKHWKLENGRRIYY